MIYLLIFSAPYPFTENSMAQVCQLTGNRAQAGNNRSHANNKSKRRSQPNLQ
jgi:hypothetical protein